MTRIVLFIVATFAYQAFVSAVPTTRSTIESRAALIEDATNN